MMKKFWITDHCRQRYIERVNNGLNIDKHTIISILKKIYSGKDITEKIFNDIPRYILYLYEHYKSANIRIIKTEDDVIFITSKRQGTENLYDVITCYMGTGNLDKYKTSVLRRSDIFIKINLIKKKLKK